MDLSEDSRQEHNKSLQLYKDLKKFSIISSCAGIWLVLSLWEELKTLPVARCELSVIFSLGIGTKLRSLLW